MPGRKILLATGLSAMGVSAFVITRPKPVPFHVEMDPLEIKVAGINIFPFLHTFFSNIPDGWRRKFVTKEQVHNHYVRDRYDCTGKSPYHIEEIETGNIWKVEYDMENILMIGPKADRFRDLSGINPNSDVYRNKILTSAAQFGEKAKETAVKDLANEKYWFDKKDMSKEDVFKIPPFSINTYVVKLASGSLLLYAPVKVRDETGFGQLLDSLGKVDWIVVASDFHTIFLPAVIKRYPEAKIIGPPAAEAKLKYLDALPRQKFDFTSSKTDDVTNANALLLKEGVQLFPVKGDTACHTTVALINEKVLLGCDLIYSHDDGEGLFLVNQERFRKFLPEDWASRLFKYHFTTKPHSPNGFLPPYRFQFMDPNSLGAMSFDQPASDGSSCKEVADSLRMILKLPFQYAIGVHFNTMEREKFRRSIDKLWNWLDGNSLIDE